MQGLYLVTDRALCGGRPLEEIIRQAVGGGVAYVQLREKHIATRLFVEEAKAVKKILEPYGVPLIINDRIDVALACGAQGVHVGQDDMPYAYASKLMGKKAIIGLSVETWEDVEVSENLDVNYIAVSPVFATPTKTDTKKPWGLEGLKKIKAFSGHPIVAIGGLHEANAAAVIEAGADCLAVVSAICAADNPSRSAINMNEIINFALKKRDGKI